MLVARYFLFSYRFLLITMAALIVSLRAIYLRRVATAVAIIGLALASYRMWNHLDPASKPGATWAVAYLEGERKEDEPILVSSPLILYSLRHEARTPADWKLPLRSRDQIPHYAGRPVVLDSDLADPSLNLPSNVHRLWTVDVQGGWGVSPIVVGFEWKVDSEQHFPEVYPIQGSFVVRRYIRQPASNLVEAVAP
jgi:hypothetical protein